jgi:hypothetical protein
VFHMVNEHSRQRVENPAEKVIRSGTVLGLANHTVLISRGGTEAPIADSAAPILGESLPRGPEPSAGRGAIAGLRSVPRTCSSAVLLGHVLSRVRSFFRGATEGMR